MGKWTISTGPCSSSRTVTVSTRGYRLWLRGKPYPEAQTFQEILAEAWSEQILPGWPPMVRNPATLVGHWWDIGGTLVEVWDGNQGFHGEPPKLVNWLPLVDVSGDVFGWCFILPSRRIHSWGNLHGMFVWFFGPLQQIQVQQSMLKALEGFDGFWFWAALNSSPSLTARLVP